MAERVLPSREDVKADIELLRRNAWTHTVGAPVPFSSILGAYVSGRLVDREASVPIAWCYLHNAVRDHHIETERCDIPRSLLVRLDVALLDLEV